MISLVVNGIPFVDFLSATCTLSMETPANDFAFVATAVDDFPPFKMGDTVEVMVDNVKKLTGHIEEISGSEQEGSHQITYSGRDKTGDVIDSGLSKYDDVSAAGGLTLKRIIETVLENIGSDLLVIDEFNPEPYNSAEDVIAAIDGTRAMNLIISYARKRQALISSNPDGNIVITQSSPTDSGAAVQRVVGGDNNIVSQSWDLDSKHEYNKYIYRGQLDLRAINVAGISNIPDTENQLGEFINENSRPGRQKVFVEKEGYSDGQLESRARWSAQLARAKAVRFTCAVKDHTNELGDIWAENTLVQVNSIVADISRKMLIKTIVFAESEGNQTVTQLELVEKDVYTINPAVVGESDVGALNDIYGILSIDLT